jgi:4-hydroxybenzoate polyprenyltransferase
MALLISLMFAYLMFKEFFIKKALDGSPLFYAFTHQLIVFPLYMWGGLTHDSSLLTSAPFLFWALSNMCASFTFEICRKLNPNAHVLAKTYAHHYGRPITATVASGFILLGGWALLQLELLWIASPLLLLLLIQLWLWVKRPQDFKKVEGLSVLFSLLSLLGPSLKILIGNGRP